MGVCSLWAIFIGCSYLRPGGALPTFHGSRGWSILTTRSRQGILGPIPRGIYIFERIDVPARPGKENRDRHEKLFRPWRHKEMALRHKLTVNKTEQTKKKGTK